MTKPQTPPPLLSLRSAVVLLLGVVCGIAVGVLAFLAGRNAATAVLSGLAGAGATIAFLHKVID